MGRYRVASDVSPYIDDGEAAVIGQSAFHHRFGDKGLPLAHNRAQGVVGPRRLAQVSQSLRRAGEGIVGVHEVGWALDLLPAGDSPLALFARRRPHVVVEGRDLRGTGGLLHQIGAFGVIALDNLFVVEKIEVGIAEGPGDQLETVAGDGWALGSGEDSSVVDGHFALVQDHALGAGVAAISVAPGEHVAIPVQRMLYGLIEIVERAESARVASGA